jgi:hypothetical protein
MMRAWRHSAHTRDREIQKRRSLGCSFGRLSRLLVDRELLTQGKVLEGEMAVAAAEDREEPEKVEQEGDHRTEIVSGSGLRDQ